MYQTTAPLNRVPLLLSCQLGVDRVVDFRFGSGETCNHIILEMYSGGNIILTDEKYEILALLRTHKFEENVLTAVKEVYPIEHATSVVPEGPPGVLAAQASPAGLVAFVAAVVAEAEAGARAEAAEKGGGGSKAKALKKLTLKLALQVRGSGLSQYGADVIHHVCLHARLVPDRKLSAASLLSLRDAAQLLGSFPEAAASYKALDTVGQGGRILTGPEVTFPDGSSQPRYDDVVPLALLQHEGLPHELFASFDAAADAYFARFEAQRLASAADHAEASIKHRVEKIRSDQQKRLAELDAAEALAMRRAVLLEQRAGDVDKVIAVLRSAVSSGVGWAELADYVRQQQDLGNPVALMVHALKLDTLHVVVLLEDDEAPESAPAVAVDIDLEKSAYANARELFAAMKVAAAKKEKTAVAAARVVEVAEKQSVDALQKHYQKRQLKSTRKIYWFEKFNW
jgi:predicted ribosome quality control (RQC) complex YloA/Tae2 family protein